MARFVALEEIPKMIPDGVTIWVSGCGGGINDPDLLFEAIEKAFLETGHPRDLVLCHSAGIGDKHGRGVDRFAHKGMVRKVIGSHWTWSVGLQEMAQNNEIEAYVLPQGVMTELIRDIAAHRPGLLTTVGIGTFIDPRLEGGRMNAISKDVLSEVVTIDKKEYLLYKSFPVDVAIFRASYADEGGNVSFSQEGVLSEALSQCQAAKNSGGISLCQVKMQVKGKLNPYEVTVPSPLIDAIAICPAQRLSYGIEKDASVVESSGPELVDVEKASFPVAKQVIARLVAKELRDGEIVNLGFGLPSLVGSMIRHDARLSHLKFTLEQGIWGGIPLTGPNFGIAYYPDAIVPEGNQFDFYDGGGIDTAVLSFAEFDEKGNVNVSKISGKVNGVGGFINIASNAKKVIFVGTFTTQGLEVQKQGKGIAITKEGRIHKLVKQVAQCSFNGQEALKKGQQVLFVTERACFSLCPEGVVLVRVTEGVDYETSILGAMDFVPIIRS